MSTDSVPVPVRGIVKRQPRYLAKLAEQPKACCDAAKVAHFKQRAKQKVCDNFIVSCMDFRLCFSQRHSVRDTFNAMEADLVSIPGGAYGLCRPYESKHKRITLWDANRIVFQNALDIAVNNHHIKRVILCCHQNCGQCTCDGHNFETLAAEEDFHAHQLTEAREYVLSLHPELVVQGCYLYFDDNGFAQMKVLDTDDHVAEVSQEEAARFIDSIQHNNG